MALPTSSTWNLADFSGASLATLLTLGPSDLTSEPSILPYFFYNEALTVMHAASANGIEGSLQFSVTLPPRYTLEVVLRCPNLPLNLGDLSSRRCGISVADDASRGFSLYLAHTGVAISRVDEYGSVTALPDTTDVTEAVASQFHTVRVAVDSELGRAYVFVGIGDTTTPALRWIVPVEQTPPAITDLFKLFVKGTSSEPVEIEVVALRLAADLVVSNYPPVADAGPDRVAPVGSALRLDGRSSYDIEGAPISYKWSCVDIPYGSSYTREVSAAHTVDDGDADAVTNIVTVPMDEIPDWLTAGDILLLQEATYDIAAINVGTGEITLTSDAVPDSFDGVPARFLRQSIFVSRDIDTPTVVPDIAGLYRFKLVVNDGESDSASAEVIANVTPLQTPFGVEPDVSPIWRAIGDEWGVVRGRDIFEESWRGVAQILCGKMLEAWQHHYNSSIRDAQRVFQKKWLAYPTFQAETSPYTATISPRYGVLSSPYLFELGAAATTGLALTVSVLLAGNTFQEVDVTLSSGGAANIRDDINAALAAAGVTGVVAYTHGARIEDPDLILDSTATPVNLGSEDTTTLSVTSGSLPSWVAVGDTVCIGGLRCEIASFDSGTGEIVVTESVIPVALGATSYRLYRHARLSVRGNRPFKISGPAAAALGFSEGLNALAGNAGVRVTDRLYYNESANLQQQGVQRYDLLVLNNGESFSVDRVVDDPLDPLPYQRVLLFDLLPLDATATWALPSLISSTEVDYERLGSYPGDLAKTELHTIETSSTAEGACKVAAQKGTTLAVTLDDATASALLAPEEVETLFVGLKRRKAIPISSEILGIPILQSVIPAKNNPVPLKENIDFVISPFYRDVNGGKLNMIQFMDSTYIDPDLEPPDVLWAEVTLFDNAVNVEALFGKRVGFLRDDAATFPEDFNYVAGVAGLMYAKQRGPSLFAVSVGATILLGQPFAEVAGHIEEIRADYSPRKGRILVRDADGNTPSQSETVRAYYYTKDPLDLTATSGLALNPATEAPWAEGEDVPQFSPLGSGVTISDLYSDPLWFRTYLSTGILQEVEKFHSFAVSFNVDIVELASIALLYSLITKIKPTYTRAFLTGTHEVADDLDPDDTVGATVTLNPTDTLIGVYGYAYDDYRGNGVTASSFDDGQTRFDGLVDSIVDEIAVRVGFAWAGGPIAFQPGFFYDYPVVDVDGAETGIPGNTFYLTYDMDLAAGNYQVWVTLKSGPVLA